MALALVDGRNSMAASTRFIVSVVFLVALAGCPEDDDPPADDGGPSEEDGGVDLGEFVYTTCDYSRPPAHAACTFTAPCTWISDFYMGYCGNETWECRAGRVVYTDDRYPCMLPYGGVDAGGTMDGGHDAGLPDAAVEAGPLTDSGAL
jgi:hypothetical protein